MHPSRAGFRLSIGSWLLAMLAVLVSLPATQADPTFDETVDFIRRTVEEHGQFRNIAGGGRIRVKLGQVLGRRLRFRTVSTAANPPNSRSPIWIPMPPMCGCGLPVSVRPSRCG